MKWPDRKLVILHMFIGNLSINTVSQELVFFPVMIFIILISMEMKRNRLTSINIYAQFLELNKVWIGHYGRLCYILPKKYQSVFLVFSILIDDKSAIFCLFQFKVLFQWFKKELTAILKSKNKVLVFGWFFMKLVIVDYRINFGVT